MGLTSLAIGRRVDILFLDARLQGLCESRKKATQTWGKKVADKLFQRLADLAAVGSLFQAFRLPGHCHGLLGNLAGKYAMRLDGGYRLVFEPANDPVPRLPDSGVDVNKVTMIRIVSVEDYHD